MYEYLELNSGCSGHYQDILFLLILTSVLIKYLVAFAVATIRTFFVVAFNISSVNL